MPCPIWLPEHTSIAPPPAIASRTHQSPDTRFLFLPLAQQLRPVAKAWIDLYVSGKKIRERGERYRFRFSVAPMLRTWREETAAAAQVRRRQRVIWELRARREWKRWCRLLEEGRLEAALFLTRLAKLEKRGRRILMFKQDRALQSWLEFVAERHRKAGLMRRAVSPMYKLWRHWLTWWEERKALQRLARRALNRPLMLALNKWVQVVDEAAEMMAKLQRYIKGATPQGRSWRAWLAFIEERKRNMALMKRAVSPEARLWREWLSWWLERKAMQRMARRALNRPLMRAFLKWQEEAGEAHERNRRMLSYLKRQVDAPLSNAFLRWRFEVKTGDRVRRLLSRWADNRVSSSFSRWRFYLIGEHQLERIIGRFRNAPLVKAWGQWEIQGAIYGAERRKMAKQASKLRKRLLGASWEQWRARSVELKRLTRVGNRLMGKDAEKGWWKWLLWWQQIKHMQKAARRIKNSRMGNGFNHWQEVCALKDERAAARRRLDKMAKRAMNRDLALGWLTWLDANEELKAEKDRAKSALRHMFNRLLSLCWRSWYEIIEAKREKVEAHRRRAINLMFMRETVRCFVAWLGFTQEMRNLKLKAVAYFSGSLTLKCFNQWREWQDAQRDRLTQFMARCLHGAEYRAWQAWAEYAAARAARLAEQEEAAREAARKAAEVEAERRRKEAEAAALREAARKAAARHAEAVLQLEEAALQAQEAAASRERERQAERAALKKAQEMAAQQAEAAEKERRARADEAAEAAAALAEARQQLTDAAAASAWEAEQLAEDRRRAHHELPPRLISSTASSQSHIPASGCCVPRRSARRASGARQRGARRRTRARGPLPRPRSGRRRSD